MFENSKFSGDLSEWNNKGFADMRDMFKGCAAIKPWWPTEITDKVERIEEVKRRRESKNIKNN